APPAGRRNRHEQIRLMRPCTFRLLVHRAPERCVRPFVQERVEDSFSQRANYQFQRTALLGSASEMGRGQQSGRNDLRPRHLSSRPSNAIKAHPGERCSGSAGSILDAAHRDDQRIIMETTMVTKILAVAAATLL